MPKKNPQVDAYIAKSPGFAKPILVHLRKLVHKTCPEVEEKLKWGMPSFEYKGLLCGGAAFKEHCTFGFWKQGLMRGLDGMSKDKMEKAMGSMGRVTKLSDLPSDSVLTKLIKEAMRLNDEGIKVKREQKKHFKGELKVPAYFAAALKKNKAAKKTFDGFSYSNQKEYVEWLTEAKTEPTRLKRLETSIHWLSEGKIRMWKYVKKQAASA